MGWVQPVFVFLRAAVRSQAELAAENLILRQQLAALRQGYSWSRLRNRDRIFWAILSRIWSNRRSALLIVQFETVVRWHRRGFKIFWRWKSRQGKVGRRTTQAEIRRLIRRMSRDNPGWGVRRTSSDSSARSVASASITSSFSTSVTFDGFSLPTLTITMNRGRICR